MIVCQRHGVLGSVAHLLEDLCVSVGADECRKTSIRHFRPPFTPRFGLNIRRPAKPIAIRRIIVIHRSGSDGLHFCPFRGEEPMSKHTGASYEKIAKNYAAVVDSKPWNAYYERPAVLSLLPPLSNMRVLDV